MKKIFIILSVWALSLSSAFANYGDNPLEASIIVKGIKTTSIAGSTNLIDP